MKASKKLSSNLQSILVDLIELHVQGKQVHWNIVGKNFRDLHLQLDEIIDAAREHSDEVAERMRALHAIPDGRIETVTATTTLPKLPLGEIDTAKAVDLTVKLLTATSDNIRSVRDEVEDEDPASADLLHAIILTLEKFAWMVGAENAKPRSS